MKLPAYICVLLTAFCLCQIDTSLGQSTEFYQISGSNCSCPGDEVVFQCTTVGIGSTRYNVTGCDQDDLNLLHTGFADGSSVGSCNSMFGVLVEARSVSGVGMTYTSNLTVQMIPSIKMTVGCYYDNGAIPQNLVLIGAPFTITPAVPQPVSNIRLANETVNPGPLLHITWNESSVSHNCLVEYVISTVDCGTCSNRTVNTFVDCVNDRPYIQRSCSFSVSENVCRVHGNATTKVFSISPTTSTSTNANGLNTPSSGSSEGVTIAITTSALIVVIAVIIVVASVVVSLLLWLQHKRDNNSHQIMLVQELVKTLQAKITMLEAKTRSLEQEVAALKDEHKTKVDKFREKASDLKDSTASTEIFKDLEELASLENEGCSSPGNFYDGKVLNDQASKGTYHKDINNHGVLEAVMDPMNEIRNILI